MINVFDDARKITEEITGREIFALNYTTVSQSEAILNIRDKDWRTGQIKIQDYKWDWNLEPLSCRKIKDQTIIEIGNKTGILVTIIIKN